VKSWFFTRKKNKIFAPPSARRNFFKCAPPSLKSWIRPWLLYQYVLSYRSVGIYSFPAIIMAIIILSVLFQPTCIVLLTCFILPATISICKCIWTFSWNDLYIHFISSFIMVSVSMTSQYNQLPSFISLTV
jgi:hypothetical protein